MILRDRSRDPEIVLRPLRIDDEEEWHQLRRENADHVRPWEPTLPPGSTSQQVSYRQFVRDLDAEALTERATRELRASGETARKRNPSTLTQLTPTELQMARLVSQGLTNKEVAEQCWLSPRTVAFHLRNVFAKTGITSRSQLAQLDLG